MTGQHFSPIFLETWSTCTIKCRHQNLRNKEHLKSKSCFIPKDKPKCNENYRRSLMLTKEILTQSLNLSWHSFTLLAKIVNDQRKAKKLFLFLKEEKINKTDSRYFIKKRFFKLPNQVGYFLWPLFDAIT